MKKFIICALCAICGFTTANAQAKFGHVNTQEIIQAMPEFATARADIEKLTQQYEADLKSMQDEGSLSAYPADLSGQSAGS